jgi:hypothetical protein
VELKIVCTLHHFRIICVRGICDQKLNRLNLGTFYPYVVKSGYNTNNVKRFSVETKCYGRSNHTLETANIKFARSRT